MIQAVSEEEAKKYSQNTKKFFTHPDEQQGSPNTVIPANAATPRRMHPGIA